MQFYHLLKVGKGTGSSVRIVVTTQPKFVKKLPKHTGAALQKKQVGVMANMGISNTHLAHSCRFKMFLNILLVPFDLHCGVFSALLH